MWSPFRKLLSAWRLIESKKISFPILFRAISYFFMGSMCTCDRKCIYHVCGIWHIRNWESDQISKVLSQVFLSTGGRPERAPRKRLYRSAAFSGHKVFVFVFLFICHFAPVFAFFCLCLSPCLCICLCLPAQGASILMMMKLLMLMQLTINASLIYKSMMRGNTLGQVNSWWLYLIGSEGKRSIFCHFIASDHVFLSLYCLRDLDTTCKFWLLYRNMRISLIECGKNWPVSVILTTWNKTQVSWSSGAKPPLSWYNILRKH